MLALTVAADRMSLLVAVLGLVADVGVVTAVVLVIGAHVSATVASAAHTAAARLRPAALLLAASVAATCTFASLWFSEVAGFVPCRLCWFQRIAMYPLTAVLTVAAIRRDRRVGWYVLPLAAVGFAISVYHYVLEWFPDLDAGSCDPTAPCTLVWFRRFGFITLPFLAASGFAAITVLVLLARSRRTGPDVDAHTEGPSGLAA